MRRFLCMLAFLAGVCYSADVRWRGGATATAQVDTCTVGGTIEADDVFILTVTGENGDTYALSTVAGSTTASVVATNIATAWNAIVSGSDPDAYLLTVITASTDSADVILTADTAGVPFSVAATTTETGGGAADDQTFVKADPQTTANSGPYDWNTVANWDGDGDLPGVDADDVVWIYGGTIYYGLNQSATAESLDAIHIQNSTISQNPSTGRPPAYLQLKSVLVYIGEQFTPGTVTHATLVLIDTGATQASTIYVFNSGTNSTSTLPAVWLKANNAATTLTIYSGTVGLAYDNGSTASLSTIELYGGQLYTGPGFSIAGSATIFQAAGVSSIRCAVGFTAVTVSGGTCTIEEEAGVITTLYVHGGTCTTYSNATTANVTSGTTYTKGSSALTTLNLYGGTVAHHSTGTVGALNVYGGTFDGAQRNQAFTITTPKLDPGGTIKFNLAHVTLTNEITAVTSGKNVTYTAQ